jgi:hypothetical protein
MAKRYGHIGPSAQREAMALLDSSVSQPKDSERTVTVQ